MKNINIIIQKLQIVAEGLQELNNKVIYVGGAVAPLYADNPNISEIRPTIDIDCIIEVQSTTNYYTLEEQLRKKGFRNDISKNAPICRWTYNDIVVDIMPTDEAILGFTNYWYQQGFNNNIKINIATNTEIKILHPAFYLATKLVAHNSRGGDDLRQSHDFEDIVYLLYNRKKLVEEINNKDVKEFISKSFNTLLLNTGI